MPRQTTLSSFQAAQRGDETGDPAPGFRSPAVPVPEQLRELVLQDDISGMPLGQVVGLVRLATRAKAINATESEIRDEAERRHQEYVESVEPVADDDTNAAIVAFNRDDDEIDADWEDTPTAEEVASFGRIASLIALDVESRCTAEMSLHMIVERVREAALTLPAAYAPTDAEIVAEAERIMASFDARVSGPREYTVAADGTVADVRPAAMTPDRGPEAGVTVHQVGDEQRWSGGGASDGQAGDLYAVPSDSAFRGKLYLDAPDLGNIADRLIERHGFLEGLVNAEIRYYWRRKTGVSKGRVKIGYCKRASDLLGHFSNADFLIWLSATTARDGKFSPRQVEAALFHQLLHIETDDEGNFISARHDFEGFAQEIRHYGTWTEDLKLAVPAFKAAEQMGLFDVDEGIDDDEEEERDEAARAGYVEDPTNGAGVLIHDDGTPLTDDEIAEMEAAELRDDDGPGCEDCGGTGGMYTHAANCDSEFCVGDGDEHSCSGTWGPCDCNSSADEPADLLAKYRHLDDDSAAAAASRADTDDDLADLPI